MARGQAMGSRSLMSQDDGSYYFDVSVVQSSSQHSAEHISGPRPLLLYSTPAPRTSDEATVWARSTTSRRCNRPSSAGRGGGLPRPEGPPCASIPDPQASVSAIGQDPSAASLACACSSGTRTVRASGTDRPEPIALELGSHYRRLDGCVSDEPALSDFREPNR